MNPTTDQDLMKKKQPQDPQPDDSGGDVPKPPHIARAALIGGAVGGFVGALVGSVVQAMVH